MTEPTPHSAVPPSVPVARIARAFSIQLICRILGMLASVVSVAMTARYLGPGRYGLLTMAVAFVGMWTSFADLGIATVIVRRVSSGRGDLERLVRINSGLALMYCVPLAVLAAGSGLLVYHDVDVRVMLVVLSGGLLLQTMTTRFEPVFLATVRFSAVAISDVTARTATLIMVAYLVSARWGVIWFAVAQLIPPAVQLLIQGAAAMRHISVRPLFAAREAVDLVRESLPLMAFLVVGLLYARADGVILSLLSSRSEVGVYGLAVTVAFNTIIVSQIFLRSTLSTATELFSRDVAAFADFLRRCMELMAFVAVPVAVIGTLLAGPLIGFFGEQAFVERGTPTLALLLVAAALRFFSGTLGQALVAAHYQQVLLRLTLATLALNISLNLVLAARFGAVGPGVALVCTELFHMAISSWWLRRRCGYRTPVIFMLRLLIPTGISVAVVLLLWGHQVVLVLGAAAVAYLATSAAVGPLSWSTLTSLRASLRSSSPPEQPVT
jgi:O-antigen/teichoic acid export membrane protein